MRIDLPPTDSWTALSDQYRVQLAAKTPAFADPALQVQIYAGYAQGIWETTQSLAKLFQHKKTIAIVGKSELIFESIATAFSEDGYALKYIDLEDAKWFDEIQAELLFVLFAEDDAVTAKQKNNISLQSPLKDKRVFRISVSHSKYATEALVRPAPYEARIFSLSPQRALFVGGERWRVRPPIASQMHWPQETEEQIKDQLHFIESDEEAARKVNVQKFEAKLPQGFQPYFKPDDARTFDRAVIYNTEFDGSAVIDRLAEVCHLAKAPAGETTDLESTSACRWENPRFLTYLEKRGESPEVIRSLVMIEENALSDELSSQLTFIGKALRDFQNG